MIKSVITVKESEELARAIQDELKDDNMAEKTIGALLENSIKPHRRIYTESDRDGSK